MTGDADSPTAADPSYHGRAHRPCSRAVAYPADLSAREVDVLRLAARGLSNKQIAAELSLSDRTVGNHLARVYDKIGNRTRAGAAVFAIEHGLLPARD